MFSPKQRRYSILTLLIGLLILILWFLFKFLYHPSTKPVSTIEPTNQTQPSTNSLSQQIQQKEQEARNATSDVLSLAKQFVARFGSYSNESVFENIRDVLPLMSKTFQQKTEDDLANKVSPKEYYGVTTRVITAKTIKSDETTGEATVKLTTQRNESIGSPQNSVVKYQDIILSFVKESGVWKIDSANWQ